jgi:hypothetical protein
VYELPIISQQARDLVEAQFLAGDDHRRRSARPHRTPLRSVRGAGARSLRGLADRVEPRTDARPSAA